MTQDTIVQLTTDRDNWIIGLSVSGKLYRLENAGKSDVKWVIIVESPKYDDKGKQVKKK